MADWLSHTQRESLAQGQVHVWLFHLNFTPPAIKRFYPLLSQEQKDRSERFIHFIHRKRYIAAHGFVRTVLGWYLDAAPETLVFDKSEHGKPFLCDIDTPLHYNLTHSNNLAMLSVSPHETGIDVEYLDRKNQWQGIIRRFFTPTEQEAIFALPEARQRETFFQVWTRKEAHMKVTGEGLHLPPSAFEVSVPPKPAQLIAVNQQPQLDTTQWSMQDLELPESARDYCACVSVQCEEPKIKQYLFGM